MWRVMVMLWTAEKGLSPLGRMYLASRGARA